MRRHTFAALLVRHRCATICLFSLAGHTTFAMDAACEPVLKASEARINQPAWHSISEAGGMRMEVIKASGQFFLQVAGKWTKFSMNVDAVEREFIAQMRKGEAKLSQCRIVGNDVVDGVPVFVISSTTELKGMPPAESKLYVGKQDGLPYRQTGTNMKAEYRYKGVAEPKL